MRHGTVRSLIVALALATPALVVGEAGATPAACKAKKAKRAKHAPKAEVVNGANVAKWYKRGDSEDDIIAKARTAGWTPSKRDEKVMRKKKVPPTLIAQLKPT